MGIFSRLEVHVKKSCKQDHVLYRVFAPTGRSNKKSSISPYRVLRWQPLEVSVVSIPADPQAVIGRAFKDDKNIDDVWRRVDQKMRKYNTQKIDDEKVDRIFNNADFTSYGEQLMLIAKGRKTGSGGPDYWDPRLVLDRASQGLAEVSGGLGGFLAQPGFSERLLFGQYSSPIIKKVLSLRAENLRMKLPYAVSQDRSNGLPAPMIVGLG